jgi:hypothetical protein
VLGLKTNNSASAASFVQNAHRALLARGFESRKEAMQEQMHPFVSEPGSPKIDIVTLSFLNFKLLAWSESSYILQVKGRTLCVQERFPVRHSKLSLLAAILAALSLKVTVLVSGEGVVFCVFVLRIST